MVLFNNDKIKINIQNVDGYTLSCESYIYIEGKANNPADVNSNLCFSNNGLPFIFSELKYKLNGIEIQKLKYLEISSDLKGYCSFTSCNVNALKNTMWDVDEKISYYYSYRREILGLYYTL